MWPYLVPIVASISVLLVLLAAVLVIESIEWGDIWGSLVRVHIGHTIGTKSTTIPIEDT